MTFTCKLEHEDGMPADPPTMRSVAGVMWRPGHMIPLGAKRTLRVVVIRDDDAGVENVDVDVG